MALEIFHARLAKAKAFRSQAVHRINDPSETELGETPRARMLAIRQEEQYGVARQAIRLERWREMGERLPDYTPEQLDEAGQVLCGVNNGVKASLLVLAARKGFVSSDEVVKHFKEMFSGTELLESLRKRKNGVREQSIGYCRDSLCAAGLLEEAVQNDWGEERIEGFSITEKGRKLGVPAALGVLWYENHEDKSVYPVLGQTQSSNGAGSPLNRGKLLNHLVRRPYGERVLDIEKKLSMAHVVASRSLFFLENSGLVQEISIETHTGRKKLQYEPVEGKSLADAPEQFYRQDSLSDHIVNVLKRLKKSITIDDVYDNLPDSAKEGRRPASTRTMISDILSRFEEKGFFTRVDGMKAKEKYSDIILTQKGREFFLQVVDPVLRVTKGVDLLTSQVDHMHDAQNNFRSYAKHSADLYYPHSNSGKRKKIDESKRRVFELVISGQHGFWTNSMLSERTGFDQRTVSSYLQLASSGISEVPYADQDGNQWDIHGGKVNDVWRYWATPHQPEK